MGIKKAVVRACLLCLMSLGLCGCIGPKTTMGVRINADKKYEFSIDSDYREIYKKLLSKARQTQRGHFIGASYDVEGELREEDETGTISMYNLAWYGVHYTAVIDVRKNGEKKSCITLYTVPGVNPWLAKDVEKWAGQ